MSDRVLGGWTARCPYFTSSNRMQDGREIVNCTGRQRLVFFNRVMGVGYAKTYCASNDGWKNCTIYQMITQYYENGGNDID